uniref:Uncharacterized protein n=1 Tax=Globodera rostochiensis TaxID=31243 RepID=A0A914HMQ7_GLORO
MTTNIQIFLVIFIVLLELGGFANGFECWNGLVSRHPDVESRKLRQITCSELKSENVCYAVKCTDEHGGQNATIHVYDCEEDRAPCYAFNGIQDWVRRTTGLKKLHCDCIICHNSNCNKDFFPFETKVAPNVKPSAEQVEPASDTELPDSENTTAGKLAFVRSDSAEEPEDSHTAIISKKRALALGLVEVTSAEHSSADASAEDKTVGVPISFNAGSSSLAIDGTLSSEKTGSKSLEAFDGTLSSEKTESKSSEAIDDSSEKSGSKSLEANDGLSEESESKSLEGIYGPLSSEEIGWDI